MLRASGDQRLRDFLTQHGAPRLFPSPKVANMIVSNGEGPTGKFTKFRIELRAILPQRQTRLLQQILGIVATWHERHQKSKDALLIGHQQSHETFVGFFVGIQGQGGVKIGKLMNWVTRSSSTGPVRAPIIQHTRVSTGISRAPEKVVNFSQDFSPSRNLRMPFSGMTQKETPLFALCGVALLTVAATLPFRAEASNPSGWKMEVVSSDWELDGFKNDLDRSGIASVDSFRCLVVSDKGLHVRPGLINLSGQKITATEAVKVLPLISLTWSTNSMSRIQPRP